LLALFYEQRGHFLYNQFMSSLLLKNASVILPGGKQVASVLIENEKIARIIAADIDADEAADVDADEAVDLSGCILYPGFIDIHIHGAAGVDVMTADLAALEKMAGFLARHGVTRWMPTFVPDSAANYRNAAAVIDEFINWQKGKPVAQIAGIHYEGPFVSEKQCGALREEFFRVFENKNELSSLPTLASDGAKHLMTLAPEVSGGIELIKELRGNGWIVSIGHTRADPETLNSAFDAGARHMTHFFNAMSGLHHRDVGAVGWGLTNKEVTCDVIADGIHVNPEILKLLAGIKTPQNISLISDSVLPAGLGDGDYVCWNEKISVKNGRTTNERGSIAGSVITMLDAVRMMLSLGISENDTARMASANPANILGIAGACGSIETGKSADLAALDKNGSVKLAVIGGVIVT
jgi:N-acetylglucosamine-6-phosphate deacetylase